jgi:myo-inositol-1(or 4)-monophosphatase
MSSTNVTHGVREHADPRFVARFAFAEALSQEAGRVALDYFERVETLVVHSKGPQDMASEADLAVERLIRARLADQFPDDAFLGEETGESGLDAADGVWVVDPIDGTQPFVNGLRAWCVSIAYVHKGELLFGLVNNPAVGELFAGARWSPATRNGAPIQPHSATSLADGLTYLGASPRVSADQVVPVLDRLLRAGGMFVRGGSGALGLCDVACGRLIGYVEPHINSWDCLGAVAVLEAAGCRVSDFLVGDALLKGNQIVAGPPAVYDQLVALLG